MSSPSALWLFAHRGLAAHFHQSPTKLVELLDGGGAASYLEHTWSWAREAAANQAEPARPPLRYGIDRPRPGLAIVWMAFEQVTKTGEPWHVRLIVRDPDPVAVPSSSDNSAGLDTAPRSPSAGYARMFLLEHSEYATELTGGSPIQAIVCEALPDGRHRNFGVTISPTDEQSFDRFVIETLRNEHAPAAQYTPPRS